jgi:hypothetical protein
MAILPDAPKKVRKLNTPFARSEVAGRSIDFASRMIVHQRRFTPSQDAAFQSPKQKICFENAFSDVSTIFQGAALSDIEHLSCPNLLTEN